MLNNTPPITRNIIILNIILYIVTDLLFPSIKGYFSTYLPTSPHFYSWQVITHMFMHSSFMHLAFNMFTLWSFGNVLERVLGQKQFVILYFLSGLGAFILFNFWNYYQVYEIHSILIDDGVDIREVYQESGYITPNDTAITVKLKQIINNQMLGASGAVFGVMAGFCSLFPNERMYFLLIPFPIKAKFLLPIIIIISAFLGIKQFSWDNIAHFAHIGGAFVGWVLVMLWKKNRNFY